MSPRRNEILLGISIVAVFFAVRIALLVVREPFFDELFTVWLAQKPFGEILPALRLDSGPPLYYFLARIPSVTALRVLSLVFATVPLVLLLQRKHYAAAALLAVYPPAALYAVDARAYALCGALVAVGVLLMDDDRQYGAALSFAGAAYTHYLGLLFLPALYRKPRALALAAVLVIPAVLLAWSQPAEAMAWVGGRSALEPLLTFAFVGKYVPTLLHPAPWALILIAAALVLLAVAWPLIRPSATFSPQAGRRAIDLPSPRLRGEGGAKRRVRGPYVVIPVALAILAALAGRGVYFPLRFESVVAVPLMLWIAAARKTWLVAALCAIGAFVTLRGAHEHFLAPRHPYAEAADAAVAQARPGETVVAAGYLYLPVAVQRSARAFPADQALHPGWRSKTPGKAGELPPEFLFVGERAGPEARVVRENRRCSVLYLNSAAVVARCQD